VTDSARRFLFLSAMGCDNNSKELVPFGEAFLLAFEPCLEMFGDGFGAALEVMSAKLADTVGPGDSLGSRGAPASRLPSEQPSEGQTEHDRAVEEKL
jgi:hypothetical protein